MCPHYSPCGPLVSNLQWNFGKWRTILNIMCFFLHFYNAFKSKRSLKMIMCYWHARLRLDMTDATAWIIWTGVSPEVFIRSQHFDLFNKAQRINSSSQEQQVTGSMFGLVFVRDYFWGFGTPRKKWNLKKERERNKNLSRLLWTVCFLQA